MKKLLIISILSFLGFSLSFGQLSAPKGTITFTTQVHDFGQIKLADGSVTHEFNFKNTGTGDLKLSNVRASCGCTVPSWPRELINPQKEGTIKVVFKPAAPGAFQKTVTVYSNATNSTVFLKIKGVVI